jgi:hypothetical protein
MQARQFAQQAADLFVAIGEDWQVASLYERLPSLDARDQEATATTSAGPVKGLRK